MLHSASNNASGVPEQLQQKHLEEQRKKSEQQALIQARALHQRALIWLYSIIEYPVTTVPT